MIENPLNISVLNAITVLNKYGTETKSRVGNCRQIVNFNHKISSDILRLSNNSFAVRKNVNYAYQIVERNTFIQGVQRPSLLIKYVPNLNNYKNEFYERFDGDYAPRIGNALIEVYQELKHNPESRRAVITIRDNKDNKESTLDHPCTLSFQFLKDFDKLDMIVTMRSNDAYISFLGYDTLNFLYIHNLMSHWLGMKQGNYHLNVGSFHMYDIHKSKDLQELNVPEGFVNLCDYSFEEKDEHLDKFFYLENRIRNRLPVNEEELDDDLKFIKKYWERKNEKYFL